MIPAGCCQPHGGRRSTRIWWTAYFQSCRYGSGFYRCLSLCATAPAPEDGDVEDAKAASSGRRRGAQSLRIFSLPRFSSRRRTSTPASAFARSADRGPRPRHAAGSMPEVRGRRGRHADGNCSSVTGISTALIRMTWPLLRGSRALLISGARRSAEPLQTSRHPSRKEPRHESEDLREGGDPVPAHPSQEVRPQCRYVQGSKKEGEQT